MSTPLYAAISVGPISSGTNTFDTTPAATEWATATIAGAAGDLTTAAALEADVIASINAASITTTLGTSSTMPISANALARRNTAQNWLQTPPTGVKYSVLMATLRNDSGYELAGVDVSYDLGNNLAAGTTVVEEIPGHRVFYSQTGAPGSWALAPTLSGGNEGRVNGTLNLGTWGTNALLYILWVDDNAAADRNNGGNEEGGYTIDNWVAASVFPPRPKDLVFQQGLDGYTGAQDTYIRYASPDTIFGSAGTVLVDGSDSGGQMHGLIRFDNIFGLGMTQIPPGATIQSASLTIRVTNVGADMNVHRMLAPWDQTTSTWNTMVDGVVADDFEAAATADATFTPSATGFLVIPLPVSTLQAWSDGTNNYGWVMLPTGTDGLDFYSSEVATVADHPKLMVTWGTPGEPSIKAFTGTALGFTLVLQDGDPPGDVNASTIAATFNGVPVTTSVSKVGGVTTIAYTAPTRMAAGTTNTVSVALKHTGSQNMVVDRTYVVAPYSVLTPSLAVTGVDTTKPGFRIWPYQTDGVTTDSQQPNNMEWTEEQFLGLHGGNIAYLNDGDSTGGYTNSGMINYSIEAGTGTERGNFTNDAAFPGIPGGQSTTGNSSIEAVTFLYFPSAGAYSMGVNSDDGFKVTAGLNPRDRFSLTLGEFNGGRGATDTLFDIVVEQPGYYAFRLLWENGNSELPGNQANCEWFTVAADGTKILINDLANPNAVKAYSVGPLAPFVKWVRPRADAVDVPLSSVLEFGLGDGSASIIAPGSIQLFLNGSSVAPSISKAPGTNVTIVSYDPPGDLAPEETNTVRLVFRDNATPAYSETNDYRFVTTVTRIPLLAIDEATVWRYDQSLTDLGTAWKEKGYNDSLWPQGAALLAAETGTTIEPIRTTLTLGSWVTYYFRIHFNYTGPTGVRLRLRYVVDDGAVFYLNGTEVHRFGIAAGAVFTASTTFADHEGRDHYQGPVDIPTAALVQGDNVLAVEVHQTSSTSSDLVFGAVLDAVTSHLARNSIEYVSPAANAVDAPRGTTIGVSLVDGTATVAPSSVHLWVNGSEVTPVVSKPSGSATTSVSYNPGTSLAYGSPVRVKLQFTDSGPTPNVTTHEWTYTTARETVSLIAIDAATLWRYEVTGQDLGTAWKEKIYDDSLWPEGAALFADETGATAEPIRTPFARSGFITFYFRTHFNYTGSLAGITLRLRHVVDDGAVFYLNGVEVNRTANMPPGSINYLTVAMTDQENAWRGPFDLPVASLVRGDNVFAVEVHQNSATSSDVVFGAELAAVLAPPPGSFTTSRLEGGGLRIEWTGAGTLEQANAVTGPWATAPDQSNPQIVPVTDPAKFYRLKQ